MEPFVTNTQKNNERKLVGFSRGLYKVAPKDAFDLTKKPEAGAYFESLYDDSVKIEGECRGYVPVNNFDDMDLPEQLLFNIMKLGFKEPLPIQKATFSLVENGCHIFGLAKTCSGKTGAFLIPVVKWIIVTKMSRRNQMLRSNKKSPYCIVLSPTKELAEQSYHFGRALSDQTSCACVLSIGGTSRLNDYANLVKGCDILFCTVGRLYDYVSSKTISLENLRFFVFDEVDEYFANSGSLDCIRDAVVNYCKESQVFMFSATESEELKNFLKVLGVSSFAKVIVGDVNAVNPHVQQAVVPVTENAKRKLLLEILVQRDVRTNGSKVIVFTNTKRRSTIIASYLCYHNIPAYPINGNMAMILRHEAVESLFKKEYAVIVATDVLSRGVDFKGVNLVINYDLPRLDKWASYVHRLGRTARLGNDGLAITFYKKEVDILMSDLLCQWLERSGQSIPEFLIEDANSLRGAEELSRVQGSYMADYDASSQNS